MKPPIKLAIAVVVLVVAYLFTTWWSGSVIEESLQAQAAYIERQLPGLLKIDHTFERGFFRSKATFDITFPTLGNQKLKSRYDIAHGPFAGGSIAAGVANIETTLENAPAGVAQLIDPGKPLLSRSVFYFGGGERDTVFIEALEMDLPTPEGGKMRVAVQGLDLDMDTSARNKPEYRLNGYSYTGKLAALRVENDDIKAEVRDVKLDIDAKRVYDDNDYLFVGPDTVTIGSFTIHPKRESAKDTAIELQQVSYEGKSSVKSDFLQNKLQLGAETFKIAGQNYGPAHFDYTAGHLHAPTLSGIINIIMTLYRENMVAIAGGGKPDKAAQAALAMGMMSLTGPAFELLGRAPEISIDRLSFNTPQGAANLAARVTIKDFKPTDIAKTAQWLKKLDANAEVAAPVELVVEAGGDADTLADLAKQGYITQENGVVKSKATLSNGELNINGKPFPLPPLD